MPLREPGIRFAPSAGGCTPMHQGGTPFVAPCTSVHGTARHGFRSGRSDLNRRPLAPKASALPGCATPRGYETGCTTTIFSAMAVPPPAADQRNDVTARCRIAPSASACAGAARRLGAPSASVHGERPSRRRGPRDTSLVPPRRGPSACATGFPDPLPRAVRSPEGASRPLALDARIAAHGLVSSAAAEYVRLAHQPDKRPTPTQRGTDQ